MVLMARQATGAKGANAVLEQAGELRYVARQPILDMRGKAHGYELLFWNGREPNFGADRNLATRTMLDNTVIFGVEELARGLRAFVNCTPDSLTEEWVQVLPPSLTVLELPSGAEPTPQAAGGLPQAEGVGLPAGAGRFHREGGVQASGRSGRLRQGGYRQGGCGRAPQPAALAGQLPGSPGGAECGDAGAVRAGLPGRLRALSGVLFLPSGGAGEPQDSRQPAGASGDSGGFAERSRRPATPEPVGECATPR